MIIMAIYYNDVHIMLCISNIFYFSFNKYIYYFTIGIYNGSINLLIISIFNNDLVLLIF